MNLNLYFLIFLIEFIQMPLRQGRPRAQQWQIKSSVEATYETHLLERLAQTLSKGSISSLYVEQARRLGATSFRSFTNLVEALSWLTNIQKILDEGLQCPNEDRVRMIGFLLEGDARKWWVHEQTIRRHMWDQFKHAFNIEFYPLT